MGQKKLIADQFHGDKRVTRAKALLKEALRDHKRLLKSERSPNLALQKKYEALIKEIGVLRGRSLVHPYLASGIGKGALVELLDGSVKYDFITGIGVHFLGHSSEKLLSAGIDAALEDTVMQGHLQQSESTVKLLRALISAASKSGACLAHCFLSSSGAMANENALKIIFQKKAPASRVLAFGGCFAGRTLATAQITDKAAYREGLPKTLEVDYVPFFNPEHPSESTTIAVQALEAHLANHPNQYAAMCFELIQGEGGYYPGERNFFTPLMKILKERGICIWVDEIQTFGRTSELFAFQYYSLDSFVDVVTSGKMLHACATLFSGEYNPKPGLLSQTFTASTSAIHAALAILKELSSGGYFGEKGKIERYSKRMTNHLSVMSKHHPDLIRGPFGFGIMTGFTVLDGSLEKTNLFLSELFKAGVIAFSAGKSPTRVRMLMPAGGISERDIDRVCAIVEETLEVMGKM